jgi:hypothetical protein
MAAHRKLDQRRVCLYGAGLRKCGWNAQLLRIAHCRPFAPNQSPFKEDRGFIDWLGDEPVYG